MGGCSEVDNKNVNPVLVLPVLLACLEDDIEQKIKMNDEDEMPLFLHDEMR